MTEATDPGGPLWYLGRLDSALRKRQKGLKRLDDYYTGKHPMAFATSKYRKEFGEMLKGFSDNWMPRVVGAPVERLTVDGFRFPDADPDSRPKNGDDATQGDRDASYIWQANGCDAESPLAITDCMVLGTVYGMVDPTAEMGAKKVAGLTFEHPSQVIVECDAGNRRIRRAALKRWTDDWGTELATIYTPTTVFRYQRDTRRTKWVGRPDDPEVDNPLGVVSVIPIENRERLLLPPTGEHETVIPLQDAVNKLALDMLVAAEFGAFFQRWATGVSLEDDDSTGQSLPPTHLAGADRVMWDESKDAKFGQFSANELMNYVVAIEMVVQHIAALSSTPPHYLLAKMANLSGDALTAAEAGLVAKVMAKMRILGEPMEELIRLCFKARSDPRADAVEAETIWRNPAFRSEAEMVDAAVKRLSARVPTFQVWEDLGYSSAQRSRFRQMLREEAFERQLLGIDDPIKQAQGVITANPVAA